MNPQHVDSMLVQWGDRLFYPANRIVKSARLPTLDVDALHKRAAILRRRIVATVVRRAPQVMVKVTGGGRGMKAITAHFRYISKNGGLEIEDERGTKMRGREVVPALADDWRFGGSLIDDVGYRREAFNIMLSMPRGTDPTIVQRAAQEFAQAELRGHKYVMVLHDHQANPHVHISVRAESKLGRRLNPRKSDLQRWRETFAERLRGWGIDAEATRQTTRPQLRREEPLWRLKAKEDGRLRGLGAPTNAQLSESTHFKETGDIWAEIAKTLAGSDRLEDRKLAAAVRSFISKPDPVVQGSAAAESLSLTMNHIRR